MIKSDGDASAGIVWHIHRVAAIGAAREIRNSQDRDAVGLVTRRERRDVILNSAVIKAVKARAQRIRKSVRRRSAQDRNGVSVIGKDGGREVVHEQQGAGRGL